MISMLNAAEDVNLVGDEARVTIAAMKGNKIALVGSASVLLLLSVVYFELGLI